VPPSSDELSAYIDTRTFATRLTCVVLETSRPHDGLRELPDADPQRRTSFKIIEKIFTQVISGSKPPMAFSG
jgi:hypothetical protein